MRRIQLEARTKRFPRLWRTRYPRAEAHLHIGMAQNGCRFRGN
jgi:hypothetical protein